MSESLPLCVDLDGTLVRADLSIESLLFLLKKSPGYLFLLPGWFLRGRAWLKHRVAEDVDLPILSLPYQEEFLKFLREEHARGRKLYLVTASDIQVAEKVAAHLAIFEGVMASDGKRNLSGEEKAKVLREKFGEKQFSYAGNSSVDLRVWQRAGEAILVDVSESVARRVREITPVSQVFGGRKSRMKMILKAMRIHHWTKNLLVFIPWITAHKFGDPRSCVDILCVFLSFGLCTSGTYVVNDLLDLAADRKHPEKRFRPFASGDLSLTWGTLMAPLLVLGGIGLSWSASHSFFLAIGGYVLLTTAYSLYLKDLLMVDVLALGLLYTIRILAGAMAIDVPVSPWLMLFSMFWFLSLALMKRFIELSVVTVGNPVAGARGYLPEDLALLSSLGASSGYLAVLVFALYADSSVVTELYFHPRRLWLICVLLLYWISRTWMLAQRGRVHEDPVRFAVQDKQSYCIGLLAAILFWISGAR